MHARIRSPKKTWLPLTGFLLSFAAAATGIGLLLASGAIPWPFEGASTPAETYRNALVYAPVFLLALMSMVWLWMAGIDIGSAFRWKRFSWAFAVGLSVSAGAAFYMLIVSKYRLKGMDFWPPVVILCIINAVSEELIYRLSFFRLLKQIIPNWHFANLLQSLLYASVHLPIGGIRLAAYAAGYGFLMGWITEKDRSILPCIACHFLIDIGYVGLPLLIV